MYDEVREYIKVIAPEQEKIVKLYKGKIPVFDHYDISRQIKSLFSKYVSLKRGAYLIIEHTEAMHVIDVNSGNRAKVADDQESTAMDVNLMAAEEIEMCIRDRIRASAALYQPLQSALLQGAVRALRIPELFQPVYLSAEHTGG